MYDKLKMWIDRDMVGESLPTISTHFDDCKTVVDKFTGEVREYGSIDGLKVSVNSGGLAVIGSLAKFYNADNILPLNRASTSDAIEMLSDRLHVDMNSARITSLEFGTHFLMKEAVPKYIDLLGDAPRLKRFRCTENTLYYRSSGKNEYKVHTFYDKAAEIAKRGGIMPSGLYGTNLLRYELRFNRQLAQQLKANEVTGAVLYDRYFYKSMIDRYCEVYFSINKSRTLKTDIMTKIENVTDAFEVIVARLINNSDQGEITAFIDELKQSKVFSDPKNYSRLKAKIKSIASKVDVTETNELMNELDNEIKNISSYGV